MSKLMIAIVQDRDWPALRDTLIEADYRVTKLASTGGFLRHGNTTLLMGLLDEDVEPVLDIIRRTCMAREEPVHPPYSDSFAFTPAAVTVGGATVFITRVEQMERV